MFSGLPHSTLTVQILYKLYSLQLNCTYSNYTEAAVYVQLHNNTESVKLISSEVQCNKLF